MGQMQKPGFTSEEDGTEEIMRILSKNNVQINRTIMAVIEKENVRNVD